MLGRLAKMLISSPGGAAPWLPNRGNPFLYTLHLHGVPDPLDPNPIWEHEYAGGGSIQDVASGRNDRRLRVALDAHRHMGSRRDKESQRLVADPRVYSDVLVRIPINAWRAARYDDRLLIMVDELARMHGEDFQDHLQDERRPRYLVVPEETLAADEVLCQFGMGVFLPDAEDRLVGKAKLLIGKEERDLPPWPLYEMGSGAKQLIDRPVGLYRGQRYLLFGSDHSQGLIRFPAGLGDYQGYAALDLASGLPTVELADGSAVEVKVAGDRQSGEFTCALRPKGGGDESGFVVLVRHKGLPRPSTPVAPVADSGHTIVLGRRSGGPSLSLVALALPSIDGIASSGVTGWRLTLNADGSASESAAGGVILMGKAGEGAIYLKRPGEKDFRPIPLPASRFDCGKGCAPLDFLRTSVTDYLALMRLPVPVPLPLSKEARETGVVLGGRPDPEEAGIALTQLNQPGSLLGREGSLNHLVSRRFVRATPADQGLRVELLSSSYPAYILDHDLRLRATLGYGGGEGLVRSGEHLHIGLYILRYDLGH